MFVGMGWTPPPHHHHGGHGGGGGPLFFGMGPQYVPYPVEVQAADASTPLSTPVLVALGLGALAVGVMIGGRK